MLSQAPGNLPPESKSALPSAYREARSVQCPERGSPISSTPPTPFSTDSGGGGASHKDGGQVREEGKEGEPFSSFSFFALSPPSLSRRLYRGYCSPTIVSLVFVVVSAVTFRHANSFIMQEKKGLIAVRL